MMIKDVTKNNIIKIDQLYISYFFSRKKQHGQIGGNERYDFYLDLDDVLQFVNIPVERELKIT